VTRGPYSLLDFGDGRKLESFAGYVVDRPCPAAEGIARAWPNRWQHSDARFDLATRRWQFRQPWPSQLTIDCASFSMPVQPTPFGHVGLFPEQDENWRWLTRIGRQLVADPRVTAEVACSQQAGANLEESLPSLDSTGRARVWSLNLFGYTGASTMAMVAAGLAVTHVDAARPSVQACRQAATANGWGESVIRYMVEDAAKFVGREVRRGRRYAMVVLDPPTYGHSPNGRAWRLERDLWPLLDDCLQLLGDAREPFGLLVTGHSPIVGQDDVSEFLRTHRKLQAVQRDSGLNLLSGRSKLLDSKGRQLDAGFYVRLWSLPGTDSIRSDDIGRGPT
jgi:23S rRNA (cytosine1962-C5)-methyltransferase